MLDGSLHRVLGNLMKLDPLDLVVGQAQNLGQVPGDGLSLAVGVGGQIHLPRLLGRFAKTFDHLTLAADGDVFRLKAPLYIDAELAFGQVPNMAHGGKHLVAPAEEPADRASLGGRLHDDKRLGQSSTLPNWSTYYSRGSRPSFPAAAPLARSTNASRWAGLGPRARSAAQCAGVPYPLFWAKPYPGYTRSRTAM